MLYPKTCSASLFLPTSSKSMRARGNHARLYIQGREKQATSALVQPDEGSREGQSRSQPNLSLQAPNNQLYPDKHTANVRINLRTDAHLRILAVFFRGLHPRVFARSFLDSLPVEDSLEARTLGVRYPRLPWPRQPVGHLSRGHIGSEGGDTGTSLSRRRTARGTHSR